MSIFKEFFSFEPFPKIKPTSRIGQLYEADLREMKYGDKLRLHINGIVPEEVIFVGLCQPDDLDRKEKTKLLFLDNNKEYRNYLSDLGAMPYIDTKGRPCSWNPVNWIEKI